MSMMPRLAVVGAFAVGLGAGVIGVNALARRPVQALGIGVAGRAIDIGRAGRAGTEGARAVLGRELAPRPLGEMKLAIAERTAGSPIKALSATIRPGSPTRHVEVVVENVSAKSIVALEVLAYGFDGFDDPAQMWVGGGVSRFSGDEFTLEAGKQRPFEWSLSNALVSAVAVEPFRVRFADGSTWRLGDPPTPVAH